jgi:serine/threonine-protein kinase RsbW
VNETKAERMNLTLASSLESIARIEALAEKLAAEAGLDEDGCFSVTMAVHEAVVNAVLHGNALDPAKKIAVGFENTGDSLAITIADAGQGFDPDSLPDPLTAENILRGCGRGIFLMRSYMDEVRFRQLELGTEVILIKHLTSADKEN